MTNDIRLLTSATIALCTILSACGQTEVPTDGGFGGDTGTGYIIPDVGAGELDPGECLVDPVEDAYGYQYQCEGGFMAHIGGVYDDKEFSVFIPKPEKVDFGPAFDPYEEPKVMACCGTYDDDASFEEQPHFAESCMLDFRQQACLSLALGLKKLIDDGTLPWYFKGKATSVQNYLAENWSECIVGLAADTHESPTLFASRWDLPAEGPWNPVEGVYVQIDIAYLKGVHAPDEGPAICQSLRENDATFFDDGLANAGGGLTLEVGLASLMGPSVDGAEVGAAGEFSSLASGCSDPRCSSAVITEDSTGSWSLEEMVLLADDDLTMASGDLSVTMTDVRLELYGRSPSELSQLPDGSYSYVVPAGEAHFVAVAKVDDEPVMLPVMSATPITATRESGGWSLSPFTIEYRDDMSNTWTLDISGTDWL